MRCPHCDQPAAPGARFCTGCGLRLTTAFPPHQAQNTTAPTQRAAPPPTARVWRPWAGDTQASTVPASGTAPWYMQSSPPPAGAAMPASADGAAYLPYGYMAGPQIVNNINVTNVTRPGYAMQPGVTVVALTENAPPLLLRLLYFLFVGLWLGALWTVLAWLLIVSIVALPAGLWMINRLPQVMTLKPANRSLHVSVSNGVVVVGYSTPRQRSLLQRAPYFLLVGWWASLLWLLMAWLLVVGTLGLGTPIAFWMFNRVPAITTLAR